MARMVLFHSNRLILSPQYQTTRGMRQFFGQLRPQEFPWGQGGVKRPLPCPASWETVPCCDGLINVTTKMWSGTEENKNEGLHKLATAGKVFGLCRRNRYVQLPVYPKDFMVSFGWLPSSIDLYFGSANMVALGLICSVRQQHFALFEGHCDRPLNRQC